MARPLPCWSGLVQFSRLDTAGCKQLPTHLTPHPAVFRDDVVFLVYLYQRWIYRVDKKRANEFG